MDNVYTHSGVMGHCPCFADERRTEATQKFSPSHTASKWQEEDSNPRMSTFRIPEPTSSASHPDSPREEVFHEIVLALVHKRLCAGPGKITRAT